MPHLVREGETLSSTGYSRCEGGKGLNQATALAKAGQEVSFAGAIGEDGLFLKAYLDGLGIDTADLAVLDMPTGHAMIQVDALGNNSIVLFGGANQAVTPDRIDAVLAHYAPGDYLLLQNEISRGDTIIRRAAARGIRVVLNPSPMSDALLSWPLELVDWFHPQRNRRARSDGQSRPGGYAARVAASLSTGACRTDAGRRRLPIRRRRAALPSARHSRSCRGYHRGGRYLHGILSPCHPERKPGAGSALPGGARSVPCGQPSRRGAIDSLCRRSIAVYAARRPFLVRAGRCMACAPDRHFATATISSPETVKPPSIGRQGNRRD